MTKKLLSSCAIVGFGVLIIGIVTQQLITIEGGLIILILSSLQPLSLVFTKMRERKKKAEDEKRKKEEKERKEWKSELLRFKGTPRRR